MHQLERLLVVEAPILGVIGQREWLEGYRRLHPIHADNGMQTVAAQGWARLTRRLAQVPEDGCPRRARQRGRWCPQGSWYEVGKEES